MKLSGPSKGHLGPSWVFLQPCRGHPRPSWSLLDSVGRVLGLLNAILGSPAAFLWPSWGHRGTLCIMEMTFSEPLRRQSPKTRRPPSRGLLRPSRDHPGTILGHLGTVFGFSWANFGPTLGPLGSSWAFLGPFWGHRGAWGLSGHLRLGAIVGPLGSSWAFLGPFWCHLEASRSHLGASCGNLGGL